MVWSCFFAYGMDPIHKIEDKLDRFIYRNILDALLNKKKVAVNCNVYNLKIFTKKKFLNDTQFSKKYNFVYMSKAD